MDTQKFIDIIVTSFSAGSLNKQRVKQVLFAKLLLLLRWLLGEKVLRT